MSTEPVKCPRFGLCPAGSQAPNVALQAALISGCFLLFLILLGLAASRFRARKQRKQTRQFDAKICDSDLMTRILRKVNGTSSILHKSKGFIPKSSPMHIRFENLTVDVPSGLRILDGISGELRPSSLCAIMGPSSSGKTVINFTFLFE